MLMDNDPQGLRYFPFHWQGSYLSKWTRMHLHSHQPTGNMSYFYHVLLSSSSTNPLPSISHTVCLSRYLRNLNHSQKILECIQCLALFSKKKHDVSSILFQDSSFFLLLHVCKYSMWLMSYLATNNVKEKSRCFVLISLWSVIKNIFSFQWS